MTPRSDHLRDDRGTNARKLELAEEKADRRAVLLDMDRAS